MVTDDDFFLFCADDEDKGNEDKDDEDGKEELDLGSSPTDESYLVPT